MRGLQCDKISDRERENIVFSYYEMGDLEKQRQWIAKHVDSKPVDKQKKLNSRKKRTVTYYLPIGEGLNKVKVCRKMFLNSVGISERQVRTVLQKSDANGVIEEEKRGGREKSLKERDDRLRSKVIKHIERFPKMESHFCRQKTEYQFLSSELSIEKMLQLFLEENPTDKVSYSFYQTVFKEQKLKFHVPKKDRCGLRCIHQWFSRG